MTMNRGCQGCPREKVIKFLVRRRMILCYYVNKFLTVCLLSEKFTYQNSNFQEKIVPKMQFLAQTSLPDAQTRFLFEVKQMPQ